MIHLSWPEGHLDNKQGFSHARKHFLNIREMWDDLTVVEPLLRPRDLVAALRQGEPEEPVVRRAFHQGYLPALQALVDGFAGPIPWTLCRRGSQASSREAAHIGEGVLVVRGAGAPDQVRVITAYRPADFRLTDPDCPPRDTRSVSLRRKIAEAKARRMVARVCSAPHPENP